MSTLSTLLPKPRATLWTARILPRVTVQTAAHLDYNRDIHLDGRWIGTSGTDHKTLLLAHRRDQGPTTYVTK